MKEATLNTITAGSPFAYGGVSWVVLEQTGEETLALAQDVTECRAFDKDGNNDFKASSLRKYLNETFLKRLCKNGADKAAFADLPLDLTSDDGMKNYGADTVKIGLLSCEQYRKYRDAIPPASDWWWTCTPWSCLPDFSRSVRIVGTSGAMSYYSAYNGHIGVRPLCNLKSDISVSV